MITLLLLIVTFLNIAVLVRKRRRPGTIAFFHPYCNAGGGGERVLWSAINAMRKRFSEREDIRYVVYTGDNDASPEEILAKARTRFNLHVDPVNLNFVFLRSRRILESDLYPRFTLLAQSLAGFIVGLEALLRVNPEIFIDSMGYPLTLPLFRFIGGAKVAAYVHYPTISTDMIELIAHRESAYNNESWIARNALFSHAKLLYYRLFAAFYGLCGRSANVVMVNSSWTRDHIARLWGRSSTIRRVYPPCDIGELLRIESRAEQTLHDEDFRVDVLSVGQIRPEKNHRLQLDALAKAKRRLQQEGKKAVRLRLLIAGGCRHQEDWSRVDDLKRYAHETLALTDDDVHWHLNISFDELKSLYRCSLIGLHTMWNEHFGISVVEGLAAGNIMIAHDSGGPRMDILVDEHDDVVGFRATNVDEYAQRILGIIEMSREARDAIRTRARERVRRFDEATFEREWNSAVEEIVMQRDEE